MQGFQGVCGAAKSQRIQCHTAWTASHHLKSLHRCMEYIPTILLDCTCHPLKWQWQCGNHHLVTSCQYHMEVSWNGGRHPEITHLNSLFYDTLSLLGIPYLNMKTSISRITWIFFHHFLLPSSSAPNIIYGDSTEGPPNYTHHSGHIKQFSANFNPYPVWPGS